MNVFTFTTRLLIAAMLYLGCPGGLDAANLFGGSDFISDRHRVGLRC